MDLNKFEQAVIHQQRISDLKRQLSQWKDAGKAQDFRITRDGGGVVYPAFLLDEEFLLLKTTVVNRLERDLKYLEDQFNSL